MRFPKRIPYKIYAFIFGWICVGNFLGLILPESESFIYYHIMSAFYPPSGIFYSFAMVSAVTELLCLVPLFLYTFSTRRYWQAFYKPLFALRVIVLFGAHSYEYQFFKATLFNNPFVAWATLGIFVGFLLPSYIAHFRYAFRKNEKSSTL